MPDCSFELHLRGRQTPAVETVSATDDVEARTLAEIRLLLSEEFTGVDVFLKSRKKFGLSRDSMSAPRGRPPAGAETLPSHRRPRPWPGARPPASGTLHGPSRTD